VTDFAIFYADSGHSHHKTAILEQTPWDSHFNKDSVSTGWPNKEFHHMTSPMTIGQPSQNDYNKKQDRLPRKGQSPQGSHHPRQQRQLIGAKTGNRPTKRANGLRKRFEWPGREINTKKGHK
jgi:hypothetical protein